MKCAMLLSLLLVLLLNCILNIRRIHAQISFPSNEYNGNNANPTDRIVTDALGRQLISSTVLSVPGVTGVTGNVYAPVPFISNTGSSLTNSYCQCVPPGTCLTNPVNTVNDGSGNLDVRIVNNPVYITSVSTTTGVSCNYGLTSCCYQGSYQCGRRFTSPPGAATPSPGQAALGEYPWQVALLTNADVYLGSGALITAQHVLTTAHRIYNVAASSFKVRLGEWDASNTNEPVPAEDISVLNVVIHPNFNSLNLQNDIAIIRMSRAVSLVQKSTIATVCLPTQSFVNQNCYVAGWGRNAFGPLGAFQTILRSVSVPLVSSVNCQASLQQTRLGSNFVLDSTSFICAGGEEGRDACTGDGGSPLVCVNNNIWYVVGLVSWGIGCATGGVPGVYTNVATYLPWVQAVIAASS